MTEQDEKSRRFAQIAKALELAVAGIASAMFGLGFGFNYGVDNQVAYFLGSLRILDRNLYANDWLVMHTTQYHPAFHLLGALLLAIDRRGWAVAITQVVLCALGAAALYPLLRQVCRRTHALAAFLLLLCLLTLTTTHSVQVSYAFDYILQPSTLGSLGLVAAMPFFVGRRWLASGICFALGGLFHANYLILGVMVFALAQLFLGFEGIVPRAVRQLGPSVPCLLLLTPAILKTAGSGGPEARNLFFTMRSPHHYVVAGHERDFLPLIAWTLLGVGSAVLLLKREGNARRFLVLGTALTVSMWSLGAASAAGWGTATQLFPWRLAPFVELTFQAVFCAALVRAVAEPDCVRRLGPARLSAISVGFGVLVMTLWTRKDSAWPAVLGAFLLLPLLAQLAVAGRKPMKPRAIVWARRLAPFGVLAGALLLFGVLTRPRLAHLKASSNLLREADRFDAELYTFMRSDTPKDGVFLTPPYVEAMRYLGQRAIIVDWKASPIVPTEFMAWLDRLRDVTGQPGFRGAGELGRYDQLDANRLAALKAKYRIDYAVVRRGRERAFAGSLVFSNARWSVVDVRQ